MLNPLHNLEFDQEIFNLEPEGDSLDLGSDPAGEFFDKVDVERACNQQDVSPSGRTSEQVKHIEMLKAFGVDTLPKPVKSDIPSNKAEFDREIQKAAQGLENGQFIHIFNGQVVVKKTDEGKTFWQRIRK